MILTSWQEPNETRTWLLIGYAIRMCLELGWHEFRANRPDDPVARTRYWPEKKEILRGLCLCSLRMTAGKKPVHLIYYGPADTETA